MSIPNLGAYVTRPTCQADAACRDDATMIHVAGSGQEPKAWTVLSCTPHVRAGRVLVNQTTTAITFSYRLAEPAPAEPVQAIVMMIETDVHGVVVGDVIWADGDLVLVCPHCGAGTDDGDEFYELDQSKIRANSIDVTDGWISVWQDRDACDMHTIGWRCGSCEGLITLPDAAETSPVWS